VVLLTYSRQGEAARASAGELTERLHYCPLSDSLLADGARWWSLVCTQGCCPTEGTPYDLSSHPVAAAAVYAGLTALPERADLAAWVAGPGPEAVDMLAELVAEVRSTLAEPRTARQQVMADLIEDYLVEPRTLSHSECCRLAVLAEDLHVRDVAWALMDRKRAADHVELWRQVVTHATPPLESAPICLLGIAAWISGNGALVNFCIDKMADLDPDYTMTQVLEDIVDHAVPPWQWEDIRREMVSSIGVLAV